MQHQKKQLLNTLRNFQLIMKKYNLLDKPEIYFVDKGITKIYKTINVVASIETKTPLIASEKSSTMTVIVYCDAKGHEIPPSSYFQGS